jgi:Holliday junction resolvase-like predicted endonuclease
MGQTNFLRKLLQSNHGIVNLSELVTETGLNSSEIISYLHEYQQLGLVHSTGDQISISPYQKVQLAILAIRCGLDIEEISQALDWREFEDIAMAVLTHHGFSNLKHYRFKSQDKGHEIDVLSFKNPLILAIECKHWKRSWQNSVIKRIVDKQQERGDALSRSWQYPSKHPPPSMVPLHKHCTIVPVILTLHLTSLKCYNKVPIIPIFYFQNFLTTELYTQLPNFQTYDMFTD